MTYDFRCSDCGKRATLVVMARDRNNQVCACGGHLVNVTVPTTNIVIPCAFATTGNPSEPQNAAEKREWDRDGVRPAKGARWV